MTRIAGGAILRLDAWKNGQPEISVHNQWFIVKGVGQELGRLTKVSELRGWVVTEIVPNRYIIVTSPDGEENDLAVGFAQHIDASEDRISTLAERVAASGEMEAGGGLSDSQLYGRIRRSLHGTMRDIERKFEDVDLRYGDRAVSGTVNGHPVSFWYEILRASNGEVAGLPVLVVDGKRYARFYEKIENKIGEIIATAAVVASGRTASGDLGDVKKLLDSMHEKQAEFERKKEEYLRETNKMWDEATKDVSAGVRELLDDLHRELVTYFKGNGMGVRQSANRDGLVEVFVGSEDGVKRYQSKVSVIVQMTFKGREDAYATMANENLDEWVRVPLKDKGTVSALMAAVAKADKKGFWSVGEEG